LPLTYIVAQQANSVSTGENALVSSRTLRNPERDGNLGGERGIRLKKGEIGEERPPIGGALNGGQEEGRDCGAADPGRAGICERPLHGGIHLSRIEGKGSGGRECD
jgi:hypothetical protein